MAVTLLGAIRYFYMGILENYWEHTFRCTYIFILLLESISVTQETPLGVLALKGTLQ